jgi:hypothetical protein
MACEDAKFISHPCIVLLQCRIVFSRFRYPEGETMKTRKHDARTWNNDARSRNNDARTRYHRHFAVGGTRLRDFPDTNWSAVRGFGTSPWHSPVGGTWLWDFPDTLLLVVRGFGTSPALCSWRYAASELSPTQTGRRYAASGLSRQLLVRFMQLLDLANTIWSAINSFIREKDVRCR